MTKFNTKDFLLTIETYNKKIKKYKQINQTQIQITDTNREAKNPGTGTDTTDVDEEADKPSRGIDIQRMQIEEQKI